MAVAGHAVAHVAGREPSRLAVRFSAPVALGDTVTTRVWRAGGGFSFEAANDAGTVLKGGWAEPA
jgi:acyl dehydratase